MFALNDWGRVVVSSIVVVGFVTVTLFYVTQKFNGSNVPDILTILLGALATNFTNVVGYWIGSSSGSAAKDSAIQNLSGKS
jgi:C4-dicarboxylate transporter